MNKIVTSIAAPMRVPVIFPWTVRTVTKRTLSASTAVS